jgi:hypothetical protein
MVPIKQVFDNMSIGHTTSLYTRVEIEKWRIARENEAYDNAGKTRGHSKVDFDCLLLPSLQLASDTHNVNISDGEGEKPSSPYKFKSKSEDYPDDLNRSLFENEKATHTPDTNGSVNVKVYPTQFRRVMILFALGLSMFLVGSLSRLVSRVTNEFVRPKTLSLRRFHTLQIVSTPSMTWAGITARMYPLKIFI